MVLSLIQSNTYIFNLEEVSASSTKKIRTAVRRFIASSSETSMHQSHEVFTIDFIASSSLSSRSMYFRAIVRDATWSRLLSSNLCNVSIRFRAFMVINSGLAACASDFTRLSTSSSTLHSRCDNGIFFL